MSVRRIRELQEQQERARKEKRKKEIAAEKERQRKQAEAARKKRETEKELAEQRRRREQGRQKFLEESDVLSELESINREILGGRGRLEVTSSGATLTWDRGHTVKRKMQYSGGTAPLGEASGYETSWTETGKRFTVYRKCKELEVRVDEDGTVEIEGRPIPASEWQRDKSVIHDRLAEEYLDAVEREEIAYFLPF